MYLRCFRQGNHQKYSHIRCTLYIYAIRFWPALLTTQVQDNQEGWSAPLVKNKDDFRHLHVPEFTSTRYQSSPAHGTIIYQHTVPKFTSTLHSAESLLGQFSSRRMVALYRAGPSLKGLKSLLFLMPQKVICMRAADLKRRCV